MPIRQCRIDNKPGYKWGQQGKCYDYNPNDEESKYQAKRSAISQGIAIGDFEAIAIQVALFKGTYKFSETDIELESYTDYPESVKNNAKRALDWVEKNGWGSCGEATGKQRANQLANGEPISRDTIARMASFKRHQQNKDVPYSEGCGGLMWDAWGGTSGIEWASSKLKEIDSSTLETIKNATIGPRGGVNPSDKAPASSTKNDNPKGEGTAKGDASTSRGSVVPKAIEESLQKKADEFNKKYKEKLGYGVTIAQLRTVYQRGVGAFTSSHSPFVSSQQQWAQARVNAFLYLVKNGRPQNPKYKNDNDLLPSKHPKSSKNLSVELSGGIGFDFDGVLSTLRGQTIARQSSDEVYIITARSGSNLGGYYGTAEVYKIADKLNIPHSNVFFEGSNQRKIARVKQLRLSTFYDNNTQVINALPSIGKLF